MSNAIQRASEIIRQHTASEGNSKYCILSQENTDGRLTAAVITPSKADGIQWVTFCTGLGSNWVTRLRRDNRAAVCFAADEYGITLRGTLELLTDPESKREHWYKWMENHFPGPDDPGYCVLRFRTETYKLFVDWQETEGTL